MNTITKIRSNQISVDNKLDKYSKNKLNELKTRHNIVATSKKALREKVVESFNNKNAKDEIHLGMISKNTIDRIKREVTGIKKSELFELFDDVQRTIYEKGSQKNNALRFKKMFTDGTYYSLILLCKKKRVLKVQTIFMRKVDYINKKRNQR